MRILKESSLIVGSAILLSYGSYLCTGGIDLSVHCEHSLLKEGEVCLETIENQWPKEGINQIIWIDARKRQSFEKETREGAVFLTDDPEENWEDLLAQAGAQLVHAQRAVVFCAKNDCGSSHEVALRIRRVGLLDQVYVLYGGWKALRMSEKQSVQKGSRLAL